jgi:hypothetical protein
MTEQIDLFAEPPAPSAVSRRRALKQGYALAEAGSKRALAGAQREDPKFFELAIKFFVDYVKKAGKPTQCAEARLASKGHVPDPRERRSWGQVPVRAASLGYVKKGPAEPCIDPVSHSAPSWTWIWLKDAD